MVVTCVRAGVRLFSGAAAAVLNNNSMRYAFTRLHHIDDDNSIELDQLFDAPEKKKQIHFFFSSVWSNICC